LSVVHAQYAVAVRPANAKRVALIDTLLTSSVASEWLAPLVDRFPILLLADSKWRESVVELMKQAEW